MRARASRLADRLGFSSWPTTIMSQRIGSPLVHLPALVTINLSQRAWRVAVDFNFPKAIATDNVLRQMRHVRERAPLVFFTSV